MDSKRNIEMNNQNQIDFTAADMIELGKYLAMANIASNSNPGMGVAIAWDCRIKGMSPIDYDKMHDTIMGKVCPTPDYMLSLLQGAGGKYSINEESSNRCEIELWYKEQYYKSVITMQDCIDSGFATGKDGKTLKHNYAKMPRQMLYARATGHGCRRVCPELLFGMYTKVEMSDSMPEEEQKNILLELKIENNPPVDYTICPIGPRAGRKWSDFGVEDLKEACNVPEIRALDRGYIETIVGIINQNS